MEKKELMRIHPHAGEVRWIGLRPARRAAVRVVMSVEADPESGLAGDHYAGSNGNRHVTMIQAEHLESAAAFLRKEKVDPDLTRRNLLVSDINIHSLVSRRIRIGEEVILEVTGDCHPCSRMEENLGPGGYNALKGIGGVTARVIRGGMIQVGDRIVPEHEESNESSKG